VIKGYDCWTGKANYKIGEIVVIFVQIAPEGEGHQYCLRIYRPDGSTIEADLGILPAGIMRGELGQAGPPGGQRKIELWGQFEQWYLKAYCFYNVIGGPADLIVYRCWVSPANPKQEDAVTLYATIANIGGSDANNFRLETYLDRSLYDSGDLSLRAGEEMQVYSKTTWRAEDGSHTVRWVINPDHSVEESNYGNNEASFFFFVSPRTVTATVTMTKTSTRTQTQRTETTITVTRTIMITRKTDTTVMETVTANPTTVTRTSTITSTVTSAAQMVSNPILWLLLSTFAMLGAIVQLPKSGRLRKFASKLNALFPVSELARRISKRHVRRALFAVSLISLIVLSISSQAGKQAYASTVTTTRTITVTEWTTLTKILASTRYITSTTTDTSTFTRTSTGFVTVTPTLTVSTTTTTTTTVRCEVTIVEVTTEPTFLDLGEQYSLIVVVRNSGSKSYSIKILVKEWPANDPTQQVGTGKLVWTLDTRVLPPPSNPQVKTAGPGETRYVFKFINSWNWIKPITTLDLWKKHFMYALFALAEAVGPVFGVPDAILALHDIVESYRTPTPGPQKFYAQVSGTVMDTGQSLLGKTLELTVYVPLWKIYFLANALDNALQGLIATIGGLVIAALGIAASGGLAAPALSFLLGALSATIFYTSYTSYLGAMDPPDTSYTTVPTPPEVKIPSEIAGLPEGAAKTFATSALRYSSYMNASSVALARYAGAMVDDQEKYMLMQLKAAKDYLEQANKELDKMIPFAVEFQRDLPRIDQSVIDKTRNYVRAKGLPEEMNRALEEMGWGAFKKDLRDIVAEAPPILFGFPVEACIRYASDALKNQTVDIQNRISSLEATLKQPSWTENYFPYLLVTVVVATGVAVCALYLRRRRRLRKGYPPTFCTHCGAEIPYGYESFYCIECGKPIRKQ